MAITRKQSFRANKRKSEKMHSFTINASGLTTRRLYNYLKAHENSVKKSIRLCFHSPSQLLTTLDLDEYTLDSKQQVWAAYARINENILLYGVTYDPQNKTVSAKKFDDYMTNITEIIYNGSKRISGIGMVYNIQTRIYESDQSRIYIY
ncbi:hypothetical protein C2G38_2143444 [Gigaspora rosea]|uniref:Uncharacterized protein n=1 Tax=Gigaspora rosea TaxID=44941 RepID=A0A397UE28_9GLOM|nr:hypothetical protein C2G38_2147774 [Gigaspora rosea]RIB15681.1 hypothetical protein C2G38_2143444 [Gigaspora rosea]